MLSGTITLDQAVQVSLKAGNSQIYNYYKFVPEESGTYAFYSSRHMIHMDSFWEQIMNCLQTMMIVVQMKISGSFIRVKPVKHII